MSQLCFSSLPTVFGRNRMSSQATETANVQEGSTDAHIIDFLQIPTLDRCETSALEDDGVNPSPFLTETTYLDERSRLAHHCAKFHGYTSLERESPHSKVEENGHLLLLHNEDIEGGNTAVANAVVTTGHRDIVIGNVGDGDDDDDADSHNNPVATSVESPSSTRAPHSTMMLKLLFAFLNIVVTACQFLCPLGTYLWVHAEFLDQPVPIFISATFIFVTFLVGTLGRKTVKAIIRLFFRVGHGWNSHDFLEIMAHPLRTP